MKWIGKNIFDLNTTFKEDVVIEKTITTGAGQSIEGSGDITTLAGLNSIGTAGLGSGAPLNILTDLTQFSSSVAGAPAMYLINNANDASSPVITLQNLRDGNGLENDDSLGKIYFVGEDVAGAHEVYVEIEGSVSEAANGDECAKLDIRLANDGTPRTGITMEADKDNATAVDVTIGNDSDSRTTIAGDLTVVGTIISGFHEVTPTSDGSGTGTIPDDQGNCKILNSGNANDIVVLPAAVEGRTVRLLVAGSCELRTSNPAGIYLNGGIGVGAESALVSATIVNCICYNSAAWICTVISTVGVTSALTPAA